MNNESIQEKIELYLKNKLTGDELIAFEKQLKVDEALANDVALTKDLNEAIEDKAIEAEYAPKLKELSNKYFTEKPKFVSTKTKRTPKSSRPMIMVVALFIVLLLAFFAWKTSTQPTIEISPSSEEVFAAYYEPYLLEELTRSETTTATSYQKAIELYQQNKFSNAIPILVKQIVASPNEVSAKILLGNCYLNTKPAQAQAAIEIFESLATDKTHSFTEITQWYLAMAYIKNGQKQLAQPVLEKIAEKEIGKYPKLAKEVLLEFGK